MAIQQVKKWNHMQKLMRLGLIGMRCYVAGNMDYSIWLELANEKRYAILHPTLLAMSSDILEGMRNLLG